MVNSDTGLFHKMRLLGLRKFWNGLVSFYEKYLTRKKLILLLWWQLLKSAKYYVFFSIKISFRCPSTVLNIVQSVSYRIYRHVLFDAVCDLVSRPFWIGECKLVFLPQKLMKSTCVCVRACIAVLIRTFLVKYVFVFRLKREEAVDC